MLRNHDLVIIIQTIVEESISKFIIGPILVLDISQYITEFDNPFAQGKRGGATATAQLLTFLQPQLHCITD